MLVLRLALCSGLAAAGWNGALKALSGPPSEFPVHALPDPSLSAVPSRSVLHSVAFAKSADGAHWVGTSSFPVTSPDLPSFSLSVFLDAAGDAADSSHHGSALSVTVTDPAGKVKREDKRQSSEQLASGAHGFPYEGFVYATPKVVAGMWAVALSVPAAAVASSGPLSSVAAKGALLLIAFNDDVQLLSSLDTNDFVVGSTVPVTAALMLPGVDGILNGSHYTLGSGAGNDEACELTIIAPGGHSSSEPMPRTPLPRSHFLSATHGAEEAYRASVSLASPGSYTVRATVSGPLGTRSSWHTFRAVARALQLAAAPGCALPNASSASGASESGCGGEARARVVPQAEHCAAQVQQEEGGAARDAIEIDVAVTATAAGRYRVWTEVWSGDKPVCWLGTLASITQPGAGEISLKLDSRWLDFADATAAAPLTLRKFRVEEASNFVPVVISDGDIPVPPPQGGWPRARAGASAGPTTTMLRGCPPAPAPAPPATAATGKILLVHGYCADGNPFTTDHFTDAAVFSDPSQSRSNDAFAQLVGQRMEDTGATSIAAHSQGGPAALHLLAYYHSGLDNGGAGRKISSVGSPYQGCPLAGLLATVGIWVGAGCGTNADLTYDGAQRWLAGIPAAARAEVHYYYTQYSQGGFPFLNNYCNLAANAVLSWPNDGVTENKKALLPGGDSAGGGPLAGQCHTADMHYMSQCTDGGRNAEINRLAAR
jgi:hypothetical protein